MDRALPLALAMLFACHDKAAVCTLALDPSFATSSPIVLETATPGLETGASAFLRSRPVTLGTADDPGSVSLTFDGPAEALDADGNVIRLVTALPATIYLRATGVGPATLTATFAAGSLPCAETASLDLRGVVTAPLTGRPTAQAPGWESTDSAMDTEPVYVALDPVRFSDRVGLPYTVHIVAHRTPAEWLADPSLKDVSGAVESGVLTSGALNVTEAWPAPPLLDPAGEGAPSARYDVVIDFGGDDRLDPGDLVDGPGDDFGFVRIGDLSLDGPHAVEQEDADGGTYLGERIYWPSDIAASDPRPLVVISHGNGHRYTWYDYIGQHLASWGFVVMAHENHTQPGIQTASTTTLTNTDYLLSNLDTLLEGRLAGLVDGARIGWIGHSRGGEGIVRAYDRVSDGDYVPDAFAADDIRMLVTIAPTVFYDVNKSDPHDRPLLLIAGTADGDVNGGVDCDGCDFYRIWEADTGSKFAAYVHGADHNDFNCCGYEDAPADGSAPDLIGRDEAQLVAKGYLLAMARTFLEDDPTLLDVFRREYSGFTPTGHAAGDMVATSFREAEGSTGVLDDFQDEEDPTVASSGGGITASVDDICEAQLNDDDNTETWDDDDDPDRMNGMTHAATYVDQAAGTTFSWTESGAAWEVEVVPEVQDASGFRALSLSVAQVPRAPATVSLAAPVTFGVALTDLDGVTSTVDLGDRGSAPIPYQRTGNGEGAGWAAEFVTLRIPLADFTVGSMIDLSRLSSVKLVFGAGHGAPLGAIGLDNVEFSP